MLAWRDQNWGGEGTRLTLLTLCFGPLLTGHAPCTRLTHAFAGVSVGEGHTVVPAGLTVAGVALRQVLFYGPAEVDLLHASTLNLLHQLGQRPQLQRHKHTGVPTVCCNTPPHH